MSLHDDPSLLTIPITIEFPTTDYSTKRLLAQNWVRRRHPEGPVSVYLQTGRPRRPIDVPSDWNVVRMKQP